MAVHAGWEEARFSSGSGGSSLEVAEPVIATTWLEEEIHEAFLKIIDRDSRDVVTVIEILSPANKLTGSPGGQSFEQKRREVMNSRSSLGRDRPPSRETHGSYSPESRPSRIPRARVEDRPKASRASSIQSDCRNVSL